MFKYPVLIGLPRSGTNWVLQYIRTAYSRYGMTLPSNMDDELFGKHYKHDNIQTKIRLLEIARANGLEICVKYLINYMQDNLSWFKEFYKNADVIILKRRNLWKTYLSWLFHNTININVPNAAFNSKLHPWHLITPTDEDVLKSTIQTYNI